MARVDKEATMGLALVHLKLARDFLEESGGPTKALERVEKAISELRGKK